MLNRREWVKRFVVGSAVALTGEAWKGSVLAEISTAANPANIIAFNIASYPTLANDFGSVRFNLFGSTIVDGVITVTRAPGNVFYSMSAYCTHAGTIVDPYLAGDTNAMICYGHNSVYDIQGRVITYAEDPGQPDLPAYNTSFANGVVRVEIPGLNLKVNSTTLFSVNGATQRFQISFPAKGGGKYRVRYSPNLTTASTVIGCATTSGGTANVTQINQTTNGTRTVWVDSTSQQGFYFVEMIIAPY
jgi:Rieske Fe-S protein